MSSANHPLIAIAGASGFVGEALASELAKTRSVIALSRSSRGKTDSQGLSWRSCDFFDSSSVEAALQGVHTAIYLIHSMAPTARLDQSSFSDTDLLLAHEFGLAARRAGVRRILYLGGLIPDEPGALSAHLKSRLEVESELTGYGVPVTTLRAGLIIGAKGSSLQILFLLVRRLPYLLCPQWTQTPTQPISLDDVVNIFSYAIDREELPAGPQDIAGPEVLTYRELMEATAHAMGERRSFFNFPYFTPGLSTLWVCLITGASRKLVAPLVKSLRYPMVARNQELMGSYQKPLEPATRALARVIPHAEPSLSNATRRQKRLRKSEKLVRSIQSLTLGQATSAHSLADEYFDWLRGKFNPLIKAQGQADGSWTLRLGADQGPILLQLALQQHEPSAIPPRKTVYLVRSGLLVSATRSGTRPGRLEFITLSEPGRALIALHDFTPSLPWFIYKWTQALLHVWVVRAFERYLQKDSTRT